jgi:tRNA dimethylallyltransferase
MIAIIGATASGKSALAMELARRVRGEILSVDSMQVYRGMNVGTAKPTPAEQQRVRHHLIDVADPNQTFTVSRYVTLAEEAIASAAARTNTPLIVTGGTPLYFKSLFEGLFEGPGADAQLRARLNAEPLESLHARLTSLDPAAAARIHANDRKRVVRALEVYELTGKPISSMQTEWHGDGEPRYRATWIGLHWERDALNRRINARVKQMIADGWVQETRALLERYGELSATASEATGYDRIIAHLRGEVSLDDAIEQIKIATRQLARRQMKWFRRFKDVTWLAGDRPLGELVECVGHS